MTIDRITEGTGQGNSERPKPACPCCKQDIAGLQRDLEALTVEYTRIRAMTTKHYLKCTREMQVAAVLEKLGHFHIDHAPECPSFRPHLEEAAIAGSWIAPPLPLERGRPPEGRGGESYQMDRPECDCGYDEVMRQVNEVLG